MYMLLTVHWKAKENLPFCDTLTTLKVMTVVYLWNTASQPISLSLVQQVVTKLWEMWIAIALPVVMWMMQRHGATEYENLDG